MLRTLDDLIASHALGEARAAAQARPRRAVMTPRAFWQRVDPRPGEAGRRR